MLVASVPVKVLREQMTFFVMQLQAREISAGRRPIQRESVSRSVRPSSQRFLPILHLLAGQIVDSCARDGSIKDVGAMIDNGNFAFRVAHLDVNRLRAFLRTKQ